MQPRQKSCQFSLHLRSCLKDTTSVWKQPWETSLVGRDHMTKLRLSNPKGSLPLVKAEVPVLESFDEPDFNEKSEGLQQICAKMTKFKHASWRAMQNEERNLAVNKWLKIVLVEPLAFAVARNFYAGKASGLCTGALGDSIADALSARANATLHARANALIRYISWARRFVETVIPPTEASVYAYFQSGQDKMGAASYKSFLSSIAFAKHLLGLAGSDCVLASSRVNGSLKGYAWGLRASRPKTAQQRGSFFS